MRALICADALGASMRRGESDRRNSIVIEEIRRRGQ
jgi:hypothetical protein